MHAPSKGTVLILAAILAGGHAARAESQFVLQANMNVLRCDPPNTTYRFVGSNAPGQIFLPGEPVDIKLVFTKGQDHLYFHTGASDQQSPYKEFIAKRPGRSFAEVPYVWRYNPEGPDHPSLPTIPFRRDRLHVALDVADDWHDLASTTDRVPVGFHAVPDTDYEYALYMTSGGSELWRYLAPGVPRVHDWPRQPKANNSTGPVPGARHMVKREGNTYTYELAIPQAELAQLKLAAGTTLGVMLRAGNNSGPHVDTGVDKAVTKKNGLTLHPYWERASNCGVRWKLVE